MDDRLYLLLIIPVALLGAAVAAFTYTGSAARRRRASLAAEAKSLGLEILSHPPPDHASRYAGRGPLPEPGTSTNLLSGRARTIEWELFDFAYERRFRRNVSTIEYRYGVVAARRRAPRFPTIRLRPERWFDAIGKAAGFDDVKLGDERFDARYHVTTDAPRQAATTLTPAARDVLLRLPPYQWDVRDDTVMLWRRSFYRPAELREAMAAVEAVLGAMATVEESK